MVVAEEQQAGWLALLQRAQQAGLDLQALRGVVSDGANGLVGALAQLVEWVNHQRCVFHVWRSLRPVLAAAVQAGVQAQGLTGRAAERTGRRLRQDLVGLVRGVLNAPSAVAAAGNVLVLRNRLRVEERLLDAAPAYRAAMSGKPRFLPRIF